MSSGSLGISASKAWIGSTCRILAGKSSNRAGRFSLVLDGGEVVGCCAVIKHNAQLYELSEMAVARDA